MTGPDDRWQTMAARHRDVAASPGWWIRRRFESICLHLLDDTSPDHDVALLTDATPHLPADPATLWAWDTFAQKATDLATALHRPTPDIGGLLPSGPAQPVTDRAGHIGRLFGVDPDAVDRAADELLATCLDATRRLPVPTWTTRRHTAGPLRAAALAGRISWDIRPSADLVWRRWHRTDSHYRYLVDPHDLTGPTSLRFHCQHTIHDGGHLAHLAARQRTNDPSLPTEMFIAETWAMDAELHALTDPDPIVVAGIVHGLLDRAVRHTIDLAVCAGQTPTQAIARIVADHPTLGDAAGWQAHEFAGLPGFGSLHLLAATAAACTDGTPDPHRPGPTSNPTPLLHALASAGR